MARRYEIDELLWLRGSPLIAKPSGLPPIEEWMYVDSTISNCFVVPHYQWRLTASLRPQPDPTTTQRKQQTPRDPTNPSEPGTARRSSIFEAKHIPRGSNSGTVLLFRRSLDLTF
jgi:hypothetical protein